MAQTVVHGCDWCGEIVDKKPDGAPKFAARIIAQPLPANRPQPTPVKYLICDTCKAAFEALTQGKYRR